MTMDLTLGFESGLTGAWLVESCQASSTCATTSISEVSSGPSPRTGSFSGAFDCDVSDPAVDGHNHRSEVSVGPAVLGEYWYGWSTYIPSSWSDDDTSCSLCSTTSHYHLLTQWHHQNTCNPNDPAMQPLQLDAADSTLLLEQYLGTESSNTYSVLWSTPLDAEKGAWHDWVVHAKWSTGTDGFLQIWKDGTEIVNVAGQTATAVGCGVTWKAGLTYEVDESRSDFIDAMTMRDASGSYAGVVP